MIDLFLLEIQLKNNYKIGKSKIHGKGVISTKEIEPNQFINISMTTYKGKLKINHFGKYLNHSNNPNAETRLDNNIYKTYSIKHISIGDEIIVDYTIHKDVVKQPEKGWK